MEANDGFRVDAHNVQAPAVTLQELSEEPQEDSTELLVLGEQGRAGEYQVPGNIFSIPIPGQTGFPGTSTTPFASPNSASSPTESYKC